MINPFKTLEITVEDISKKNDNQILELMKHKYREMAIKYHPDTVGGRVAKEKAEKKFKEISEAYSLLGKSDSFDLYKNSFLKHSGNKNKKANHLEEQLNYEKNKYSEISNSFLAYASVIQSPDNNFYVSKFGKIKEIQVKDGIVYEKNVDKIGNEYFKGDYQKTDRRLIGSIPLSALKTEENIRKILYPSKGLGIYQLLDDKSKKTKAKKTKQSKANKVFEEVSFNPKLRDYLACYLRPGTMDLSYVFSLINYDGKDYVCFEGQRCDLSKRGTNFATPDSIKKKLGILEKEVKNIKGKQKDDSWQGKLSTSKLKKLEKLADGIDQLNLTYIKSIPQIKSLIRIILDRDELDKNWYKTLKEAISDDKINVL